jgi:ElaB/YqjD/DUF883 family membrane-anchored ribosome-binding protein
MTKTITHRSRVSHNGSSKSHHSVGDLKSLVTHARSTVADAASHSSVDLQALRDRLRDTISGVQTRVKTIAKAARRQAGRADDTIRANPYQAIGVAVGLGLIAGLLIARRRAAR